MLALKDKAKEQAWLDCLGAPWLLEGDDAQTRLTLPCGRTVPAQTWQLDADADAGASPVAATGPLHWPAAGQDTTGKGAPLTPLPLFFNPSAVASGSCEVLETAQVGERITVANGHAVDWGVLGSAIHACLAASFTDGPTGTWLSDDAVVQVLEGFQVRAHVDAAAVRQQIQAFHAWIQQRWSGCRARAEVPVKAPMPGGQVLNGRIDLLLETPQGFILIDHKSSPHASEQWGELAGRYQGQLAAYAQAIESATGQPVLEQWLWLPVAGGVVRV